MPVQTPNAEYAYRKVDWAKIRTFVEGARAVRAAGETYLPKITGWTNDEYNAYRARAEVYGAVDRTIDGLDGAIFRKAPQIEIPESQTDLTDDVTLSGQTTNEWIRSLVREVLTVGRHGVLVEFSGAPDVIGHERKIKITTPDRPYVVSYTAEQIINWDSEVIDGVTKLTMVVLEETILEQSPADPFVKTPAKRYRVLRLVDDKYRVELWTAKKAAPDAGGVTTSGAKEVTYVKTAEFSPVRRGEPHESRVRAKKMRSRLAPVQPSCSKTLRQKLGCSNLPGKA